jgi:endonuclease/exonuclease/phosphatase family metal-dependent hydrolase
MKWCVAAVLALFTACEPLPVEPEPEDGGTLDGGQVVTRPPVRVRLATFNLKLYFDTVCESGSCAPADFEAAATPAAFAARTNQIAQAVTTLNADVVALEEVETQVCLDALLAKLGATMPYGVLGEIGTPGSVDVAILSKTPIDGVVAHRALERLTRPDGSRTNYSREFLEAHTVTSSGAKVVFFAAHFRSKVMDDPGRRQAEAETSRRIVETAAAASQDALVVMGGDLNDTPGSVPIDALTLNGGLLRAAADLPVADQGTYVFNGKAEAIDHLLQGKTPAANLVPRSAKVWKETRGFGGSDHFALTAEYDVTPP